MAIENGTDVFWKGNSGFVKLNEDYNPTYKKGSFLYTYYGDFRFAPNYIKAEVKKQFNPTELIGKATGKIISENGITYYEVICKSNLRYLGGAFKARTGYYKEFEIKCLVEVASIAGSYDDAVLQTDTQVLIEAKEAEKKAEELKIKNNQLEGSAKTTATTATEMNKTTAVTVTISVLIGITLLIVFGKRKKR